MVVRWNVQTVHVLSTLDLSKLIWQLVTTNTERVQIRLSRRRKRQNDRWESCVTSAEESIFLSQSKYILSSVKRSGRWRRTRNLNMSDERCLNLPRSLMRFVQGPKLVEMNTTMKLLKSTMKKHLCRVMDVEEHFYLILWLNIRRVVRQALDMDKRVGLLEGRQEGHLEKLGLRLDPQILKEEWVQRLEVLLLEVLPKSLLEQLKSQLL